MRAEQSACRRDQPLEEANKEGMSGRYCDLVLQRLENLVFHSKNLVARVRMVANKNMLAKWCWVNFFVLAGDEERRDADQLKLGTRNLLSLKVPINQVDGKVQCLRNELEFQVHFHKPVDENRSHSLVDVRLLLHVHRTNRR